VPTFRSRLFVLLLTVAPLAVAAQDLTRPSDTLPPVATTKLDKSLSDAAAHKKHVWRDSAAINADGTVNGYIEIARGDRRKWELDMRANKRAIDRMIPSEVGGYPINYGIVPQTVSYDGDPFDVLVLGPAIPGGTLVRGVIVGLLLMEDEKGPDSKAVVSRVDRNGKPTHALTPEVQREVAGYFNRYKLHEPNAFSKAPGWGSAADGLAWVTTTHAFFKQCRQRAGAPCQVDRSRNTP
jgi:inorganic pyrophosphatase